MKAFLAYISVFAKSMWPFEKCEIRDAKISFHIKLTMESLQILFTNTNFPVQLIAHYFLFQH